jgi:hypothetical protein
MDNKYILMEENNQYHAHELAIRAEHIDLQQTHLHLIVAHHLSYLSRDRKPIQTKRIIVK